MDYSFWERLTSGRAIARGQLTPRCDVCRTRTRRQGAPQLFLLPIHQDNHYEASAEYYRKACYSIDRAEEIPIGQRACRMWPLVCPECGARLVLVVDFLRVRGQEVPEETVVCAYTPLAALLNGGHPENGPSAPVVQSFGYEESFGNGRR